MGALRLSDQTPRSQMEMGGACPPNHKALGPSSPVPHPLAPSPSSDGLIYDGLSLTEQVILSDSFSFHPDLGGHRPRGCRAREVWLVTLLRAVLTSKITHGLVGNTGCGDSTSGFAD